jgi:polyphenol oxidase
MARLLFTSRKFGSLADPVDESERLKLAKLLNKQVQFMAQTHGNEIAVVDQQGMTPSADCLVTANKDIALAVRVADCLPLLLLSKQAVAAVHVGRKGLLNQVAVNAVKKMQELGASNITGVVGPHICGECYEVDPQMYADITKLHPATGGKQNHLNLYTGLVEQLSDLPLSNLDICTKEDSGYFSHRASGEAGRQVGVISL